MKLLRRVHACQSGATAVEFAFVSLLLVLISIGVVDFGRGLYVRNSMSYAADKGARAALIDGGAPQSALESVIRDAFAGPEPVLLEVVVGSETIDGTTYRTLTVQYPLALKLPGFTDGVIDLSVARRVPVT